MSLARRTGVVPLLAAVALVVGVALPASAATGTFGFLD
jgi:hypothetical protein